MSNPINCVKCTNYQVTWNVNFPHGCKLWGIKSKNMPSRAVFESTGSDCPHFKAKTQPK